jgi:membrane protease YdiL (CAAX protease family)
VDTKTSSKKSPLKFFVLVFLLTIPFWVLGAVTGVVWHGIPIAALSFVCPALAAMILEYRESKGAGVKALLKRASDFKRIKEKAWYGPTLLLYPAVVVLSFFILRLTGTDVPTPHFALLSVVSLCVVFFISATGEELGWSGYAIDPMRNRWGALKASIVLGSIWAIWHWVALVQAHNSVTWIVWWTLGTVTARVIMVWLFNNMGKSVFAMALFHATLNVGWGASFWAVLIEGRFGHAARLRRSMVSSS